MSIYKINSRVVLFRDLYANMQIFSLVVRSPSSETQEQSVGSGEKAERKFSSTGERALGYRLIIELFPKIQANPGS